MQSDYFEALHEHQQMVEKLARQWDGVIRDGLRHLAQALWPDGHVLKLVPVHDYRLRRHVTLEIYTWWVEHDIPPYDQHWCAAYEVQLTLDGQDGPTLTVHSKTTAYTVTLPTVEALDAALARAGEDPPLIIQRNMGEATDP
jgi:hypothetical protein